MYLYLLVCVVMQINDSLALKSFGVFWEGDDVCLLVVLGLVQAVWKGDDGINQGVRELCMMSSGNFFTL